MVMVKMVKIVMMMVMVVMVVFDGAGTGIMMVV